MTLSVLNVGVSVLLERSRSRAWNPSPQFPPVPRCCSLSDCPLSQFPILTPLSCFHSLSIFLSISASLR